MIDFPWDKYAFLQAELRDKPSVGNRSWGIEAGLNRILSAEPLSSNHPLANDDIERAVNNEQRRERHRAELRRLYLVKEEPGPHPETSLQARAELRLARAKVTKSGWDLLCAVAVGRDYAEIATANGGAPGALRVRVLRLRREVGQVSAAG
jgi:hypothetical protein